MNHNTSSLPLVCICIPTYNAELTIEETLTSIVNQNYKNLVINIVDNASTDDTLKVVSRFDDQRIAVYRNEVNVGGEGNFNRCIELATGKYTAIFHSDDIYEPAMIEKQVSFLEANPDAGAVLTEASIIDEAGNRVGKINRPPELDSADCLYSFKEVFKAVLHNSNFFVCPSAMVPTATFQSEIGYWRGDKFRSSADLDVWLRIALLHPIGLLPEPLICYRVSNRQYSAGVRQQTERADFFLVTDHYLEQKDVRKLLCKSDFQNYKRLERRDRVMRAVNIFLKEKPDLVGELLSDIYSSDAIKSALSSKRGLGVFLTGVCLQLIIFFGLNRIGRFSFKYAKQFMRK